MVEKNMAENVCFAKDLTLNCVENPFPEEQEKTTKYDPEDV